MSNFIQLGYDLDQSVKMMFALANAEFDASIAAWDAKRAYDYVRPITAVRTRMKGKLVLAWAGPYKGTRLIRGETWSPYQPATFPTPPLPEYVSGHSTFSAAGAKVLQSLTGSDLFGARVTVRARSSFVEPGVTPLLPTPLVWATFSAALDEAGRSRRQGGIHFHDGDLSGRTVGTRVGQSALAKATTYFNGTATS